MQTDVLFLQLYFASKKGDSCSQVLAVCQNRSDGWNAGFYSACSKILSMRTDRGSVGTSIFLACGFCNAVSDSRRFSHRNDFHIQVVCSSTIRRVSSIYAPSSWSAFQRILLKNGREIFPSCVFVVLWVCLYLFSSDLSCFSFAWGYIHPYSWANESDSAHPFQEIYGRVLGKLPFDRNTRLLVPTWGIPAEESTA